MKHHIRKLVNRFGYEISKQQLGMPDAPSIYHVALTTLLSGTDKLRIVQVGANDGAVNDPLYTFVREFPGRSEILLIEPQKTILPFLAANYSFHSAHTIFNGAVGPEGTLRLYTVAPEFWKSLDVPYANGWPEYRAPSGITSASREHVHAWLSAFMKDKSRIDQAIREIVVTSSPLPAILSETGFQSPIDCLQIDTEGLDDIVVYNCSISETAPRLIHFEAAHLGAPEYDELNRFLHGAGYQVWRQGKDALAVSVVRRVG